MKITLRVVYNDGTDFEVTAATPDVIAYEDEWSRSITALDDVLRYTDCCWLAWTTLRRTDQTALDWTQWFLTVDHCGLVKVESQPAPLARKGRRISTS